MIAAFSVTPLGTSDHVADLIADCAAIIRDSGLPYEINDMFTNVQGSWDEVMTVIGRCVEHVGQQAPRVSAVVKIDHRPGEDLQLHAKAAKVEERLGAEGQG